jgi:hypothetical protein
VVSEWLPQGGGHFGTAVISESQTMSFLESPAGILSWINWPVTGGRILVPRHYQYSGSS